MIKFGCQSCGKRIGVDDAAAGKRVRCPRCGDAARVPEPAAARSGGSAALAALDADGPLGLQAVEAPAPSQTAPPAAGLPATAPQPPAGDPKVCPKCEAPAAASAKICVSCGHGFKGLSAAGRVKTRKAGVIAGRSGVAILGGLLTALVCGFLWAMVVKITGFEIGYLAIGLGAGTGVVTALIAQQQSWLVGLGAVFTALLGWLAGKVMIGWLVVMPMLTGMGFDADFDGRDAYILSRLEETGQVDDAMHEVVWGFEEVSEEDAAAWQRTRADWIATHGDPGPDPFFRESLTVERLRNSGLLDGDTAAAWDSGGLSSEQRDRVRTLIEQDLRLNGEPEALAEGIGEEIDPGVLTGFLWAIAILSSFSWFDFLWVPLMCAAAYKTGNGD